MDNDNSFECPDKKKEGIRYRRDTIEVLHKKFKCETMTECSARSFGRSVPENILKPKPENQGTSLCKVCLNLQLKVEELKNSNVTVDWLLSLTNKELKEFEKQFSTDFLITYKVWQSQPVTKNKSSKNVSVQEKEINIQKKSYCSVKVVIAEKSKKFMCKLLNDVVTELKEHNTHKILQFRSIKEVQRTADNPLNKAAESE